MEEKTRTPLNIFMSVTYNLCTNDDIPLCDWIIQIKNKITHNHMLTLDY